MSVGDVHQMETPIGWQQAIRHTEYDDEDDDDDACHTATPDE